MQVVNSSLIAGKRVLLRYDIDVALECKVQSFDYAQDKSVKCKVKEDFKLRAGLATLRLCLDNASEVILIGHVGRPGGKVVAQLSVEPIRQWFFEHGFSADLDSQKLVILENLRFDPREEAADIEYAKELANKGNFFVNEAFSSYRPAVSTTVLPSLFPQRVAGLRFAKEVNKLTEVLQNPKKPFIAIMGGAKVKDKLPVIQALAKKADAVLVGGKLVAEIKEQNISLSGNVMVGKLSEDGFDISADTTSAWAGLISKAAMIVWNGPVGKFEDPQCNQTEKVAKLILNSGAEVVIGGGDSVAALDQAGLLEEAEKSAFVSVGGGAMLKFLSDGTLPTIQAL